MTSEVIVMNRLSVALAADSASTVTGPDGKEKIWNSANKLFALSRCQPVGVMFYNDASISGVPWETLVKEFRSSTLGATVYDSLEDYACAFIDYLKSNVKFFSNEAQGDIFLQSVFLRFQDIYNIGYQEFIQKILASGKGIGNEQPELLVEMKAAIDPEFESWNKKNDLSVVGDTIAEAIPRLYGEKISEIIDNQFMHAQLDDNDKAKLFQLAVFYGTKADFDRDYTGMVFAGFGEKDLYPVVRHLKIGLIISDCVRYTKEQDYRISEAIPSLILPFAQSEMVETFLAGVSPKMRNIFLRSCVATISGLTSLIVDAIDDLSDDQKTRWKTELEQHANTVSDSVVRDFQISQDANKSPIHGALVHLPKDEIANVAESLVNLNYFQKRVSMDSETVGGPIDVAVISKGDGFIWIKRKHYFSADLNPQFFISLKHQFHGRKENE